MIKLLCQRKKTSHKNSLHGVELEIFQNFFKKNLDDCINSHYNSRTSEGIFAEFCFTKKSKTGAGQIKKFKRVF